ncbi:uncharacterized protein LOC131022261 [Salvia miltiorrhiza]|uniref:uncharacterized protein LOC131022261 n=1 Tax=Salvia miltiorrhiza TaxID=226208 RepID=UPI0025AD2B85|nr:uncharacterized protein LOC131022261 [Salvia miltiorrhiza]
MDHDNEPVDDWREWIESRCNPLMTEDYWTDYKFIKDFGCTTAELLASVTSLTKDTGHANAKEPSRVEVRPQQSSQQSTPVTDINIKCYFCQRPTQSAGHHVISILACGRVFGYSCFKKTECDLCGQTHVHLELTRLNITPE